MADKEILIQKGKTFSLIVRWETEPIIRKAITAVSLASGAPRLTVPSHGAPDGWRGMPYAVEGMKQLNDIGYQSMTVIDANTIEFNSVTPVDDNGRVWSAYTSGGFLMFYTPQSLSGYTARIDIKDKIGGTVWASSEVADTPYDIINAVVDDATKTITLTIDAADTALLTAKKGVADLELVSGSGVVTKLKLTQGNPEDPDVVRVVGEVTT
jgi:hypothetical protein